MADVALQKRCVLSITRMTVHNGPGIRTLVLFKGCPLRCLWCSTPESQKPEPEIALYPDRCIQCEQCVYSCPQKAINLVDGMVRIDRSKCNACGKCVQDCYSEAIQILGQMMSVEELVEEAKKDSIIYRHSHGGVTLSGGEPLLDPDFVSQLIKALKEEGINVGVDTCGYVPWKNIQDTLANIDFFLWDIKHMDPEKHKELTGVSNELILDNLKAVSGSGTPLYIRVPVIPGYNDSEENIRALCDFVRGLTSVQEVDLLPLHHLGESRYKSLDRPYPLANVSFIPNDTMQALKRLVESYGLKCEIVA